MPENHITGAQEQSSRPQPRADKPDMYLLFKGDEMLNVYTQAGAALRELTAQHRTYDDEVLTIRDGNNEVYASSTVQTMAKVNLVMWGSSQRKEEVFELSPMMLLDLRAEGYQGATPADLIEDTKLDFARMEKGIPTVADMTKEWYGDEHEMR